MVPTQHIDQQIPTGLTRIFVIDITFYNFDLIFYKCDICTNSLLLFYINPCANISLLLSPTSRSIFPLRLNPSLLRLKPSFLRLTPPPLRLNPSLLRLNPSPLRLIPLPSPPQPLPSSPQPILSPPQPLSSPPQPLPSPP